MTMTDVSRETLHHLRTAWHALLVLMLEHLLAKEWWRLMPEVQLTREPQRIDAVVVRLLDAPGTPTPPTHLRSVLDGLLRHNVIHFKGPTDELEVADVFQVIAYATQYMNIEGLTDPTEVSIRVVAAKLTPRFCGQLARMGGVLRASSEQPGVHVGHLGVFPLRVVETSAAYAHEHEHLLYALSPDFVAHPTQAPALDDREQFLYYLLCQSIARLRKDPEWRATVKDASLVERSLEDMRREFFGIYTPEEIAAIASPEQLSRLSPAQLAGLAPEQRLAGLAPEQRLAGLPPGHAVLALPDDALCALSADYLATLPDDVQALVRRRIAR